MPFGVNPGSAERNWLEGCVPWDGKEKYLPSGVQLPPGMPAEYDFSVFIQSWKVLKDGETSWVKTSELRKMPDAVILKAEPNNEAIRDLLSTWDENQFLFTDAYGRQLKPKAWVRKYKTNPFVVLAIMRISRKRRQL